MLFSPVYIESHPRLDAGLAACCTSSIFFNPFRSNSFRTLTAHLNATVSSNSFAIKRFRTLCKIPGIGYPPSPLVTRHSPLFIHPLYFQPLPDSCCTMELRNPCVFRRFRPLSIAIGVYTPSQAECLATRNFSRTRDSDPVGEPGCHSPGFTGHESPVTVPLHSAPRPAHNIQPCQGDRS
jgi:hypothetical protein